MRVHRLQRLIEIVHSIITFGLHVMTVCKDKGTLGEMGDLGLEENYIVCFCKEDDKLSQWRGYAPEGGVAMGFDFGMPRVFSVLNHDAGDVATPDNSVIQYVGLDAVCYISPKGDQNDDSYSEYCHDQLALVNPATSNDELNVYREEIQKKSPYIKHSGFKEEDEFRLVFRNETGKLDKCVRYRDANSESLRYPYIVVKAALPMNKITQCVVRVCINEDKEAALVKEIEAALKITYPTLVQGCHLPQGVQPDAGEPFCTGCVLRSWQTEFSYRSCRYMYLSSNEVEYEYSLQENESCVVISQGENQEAVFKVVYKCVQEFKKQEGINIAVWCEGHLPLRKITVGPCTNQNNVVEAIRHYCRHTYWLRDIEISISTIPFRKSL